MPSKDIFLFLPRCSSAKRTLQIPTDRWVQQSRRVLPVVWGLFESYFSLAESLHCSIITSLPEEMPGGLGDECKKDGERNADLKLKCDEGMKICNCMDGYSLIPSTLQCVAWMQLPFLHCNIQFENKIKAVPFLLIQSVRSSLIR